MSTRVGRRGGSWKMLVAADVLDLAALANRFPENGSIVLIIPGGDRHLPPHSLFRQSMSRNGSVGLPKGGDRRGARPGRRDIERCRGESGKKQLGRVTARHTERFGQ